MIADLPGELRTALEKLIQNGRQTFENDLATALEGHFGIHVIDGRVEPENAISLASSELAVRSDLIEILSYLRAEGASPAEAAQRLVREAAFTHLNRLVAVRVAEAIDLIPETLANGIESRGFRDFAEIAPAAAQTDWERYTLFIRQCADELAADVPSLFDPRNPLLELEPTAPAYSEVVTALAGLSSDVWGAPDALGWAYQYFNSREERKAMRDESQSPRTSRELAVRNQFFTPSYVVDFLVQNGLGAHLAAGVPGLDEDLPLLIDTHRDRVVVDLADVQVLDPACGSGHFLLGAYDVLEAAWLRGGVGPDAAAPAIVASLSGIDIDPRATQIAQTAIIFRARRHCRGAPLPSPNVTCSRALPLGEGIDEFLLGQPPQVTRVVKALAESLTDAPTLGSLLRVEKRLALEIRDIFNTGIVDDTLSAALDERVAESEIDNVLSVLTVLADSALSTVPQRIFAAEASDAVRFVEILRQRYTAVLMNPPYGLIPEGSDQYMRSEYSSTWTDLYAAFVERGVELLRPGGSVAALTSSSFFTGRKLRDWRRELLTHHRPTVLVDLGSDVLEGAANQTAMWIVPESSDNGGTHFADLVGLDPADRAGVISSGRLALEARDPTAFIDIRNSPLAFHMASEVVELWNRGATLEPHHGAVRSGCTTFDDFRFVRCWWEIPEPGSASGWSWFEKGGDFQPYVSPTRLLIDWRDKGSEILAMAKTKGTTAQVKQSSEWWGRRGLACPNISSVGFCSRTMAPDQIFSARTLAIFLSDDEETERLLWLLNSGPVSEILGVFGRSRTTDNGSVKSIPIPADRVYPSEELAQAMEAVWTVETLDECSVVFDPSEFFSLATPGRAADRIEIAASTLNSAQSTLNQMAARLYQMEWTNEDESRHEERLQKWRQRVDFGRSGEWLARMVSALFGQVFGRFGTIDPRPEFMSGERFGEASLDTWLAHWLDSENVSSGTPLVLGEDAGSLSGISEAVLESAEHLPVDADELIAQAGGSVGSLADFIRKRFFGLHIRHYTAGQRKAPIYWQLQVPSREWGVWLYAPRLSRETLFAVLRQAEQRLLLAERQVARLEREVNEGSATRKASTTAKELDAEQKLIIELGAFRAESERIASIGWDPDLNDGMVLNAAPLADLFPAWKDAAKYRQHVRDGKFKWASVAQFAEEL